MTTNTPPEVLALAREIAAKHDANKAYQYLEGSRDDYPDMRMIIAAIMEVTERAAGLMDKSAEKAGRRSIAAGSDDNMEGARNWAAAMVTCESGAAALRNWEHLK